jgi:tetratricopeptide (TPR) repeat protein
MANAWLFLGISQFNLDRPGKALSPLRHYTTMTPGDAEGHYYLGLSFLSLDRYAEAAQALLEARKIDPRNTDILYHLAQCYVHIGGHGTGADVEALRAAFVRTVAEIAAIDPNSIRLHQLMAGYYEVTEHREKAIHELEEVVRTHPELHMQGIHYTLGCLYRAMYHLDQALEQFNAELTLDTPYPRTWLQIAYIYMGMREPEKAFPFLEKAIQIEPDIGLPWVELGRAYLRVEQFDKAAAAFEKAIQRGEKSASTYFVLSTAYRRMGRMDLAREAARKGDEASRERSDKVIEHLREALAQQDKK